MTADLKEPVQENEKIEAGKMMNRIYYKVLALDYNNKLWSCGGTSVSIPYEVHKIIHAPNNTRLFVFETLEEAQDFCGGISNFVIYSCVAPEGIKGRGAGSLNNIGLFWAMFNDYKNNAQLLQILHDEFYLAPYDAILVEKLMLLERLH